MTVRISAVGRSMSFACASMLVVFGVLCLGSAVPAMAGAMAECSGPVVFEGANVNVLVLPFVDTATQPGETIESPVGTQLAALMQAHTLISILKYGRVGAVRLMGSPRECKPALVMGDVLSRGTSAELARHGVVLVWGRIYKQDTDLFVQTYVTFRRLGREDVGELMQVRIADQLFAGKLASQKFSFPPRHITEDDVRQISERFNSATIVRQAPDDSAPGKPLAMVPAGNGGGPLVYYVIAERGDWMRVETATGLNGWVHARAALGDSDLSRRFPELDFIEGLAGYFSYRVQPDQVRYAEWADRAFARYEELAGESVPTGSAVAKQLRGYMRLLRENQSQESFVAAAPVFDDAARMLPYSASAKNLAAVVHSYIAFNQNRQSDFKSLSDEFWTAASLDPEDETVVVNMSALYETAMNPAYKKRLVLPENLTTPQIKQRLETLQDVKVKGTKVPLRHKLGLADWPMQAATTP